MNRRRNLLKAFGAGVLASPLALFAQQEKPRRIGFLSVRSRESLVDAGRYGAFLKGMQELGYVEGKHFLIEGRYANGRFERVPGLAEELVRLKVDVIVAEGNAANRAAQQATTTIPVVITVSPDPVGQGFAASLARPGGNVTGLAAGDVVSKYLELITIAVPRLSRIAVLSNPANAGHAERLQTILAAAQKAGVTVVPVDARNQEDIERAFARMAQERVKGVVILADTYFAEQEKRIAELALKRRLPSIFNTPEYPEAGGLMSYGPDLNENFRHVATFVDKILKGAKPGELPFELPMRLHLVINRKTAKAIGLAIPQELLLRADRVIE
jgi:putative ABC transport system substrate-binding protein